MKTTEITPKTLVAVIAAQIKEDAEIIARKVVTEAKGNDIDYTQLIEKFIIGKSDNSKVVFSEFCNMAFEEVKSIDKFLKFKTLVINEWHLDKETGIISHRLDNQFQFELEIDELIEDIRYKWNKNATASGKDIYVTFDDLKNDIKKRILNEKSITTQVILDETKKE